MRTAITLLTVTCLLYAIDIGRIAYADAPVAGKVTLGVTVTETQLLATGWRVSKLIGSDVKNDKGEKIGTVDDVVVAPGGQLTIAVLQVGGFLGIGSHKVAIPVRQLELPSKVGKPVLPGATQDSLKKLPEFEYTS